MVRGLDIFRERFREFKEGFVLIGGAACDDWFSRQNLDFRATRDLDIVLLIHALDQRFVAAFRAFIDEGGYAVRQRSDETPILYRFAKPSDNRFPSMLELFSRDPEVFELADGQTIIPVGSPLNEPSLSAILLDAAYANLVESEHVDSDGLHFASVAALIPLKARAWLDLSQRLGHGEKIDSKDIDKHRSDIFRLAATLPDVPGPDLPTPVREDLEQFLGAFPESSPEWPRILSALKAIFGNGLRPERLLAAVRTYFRISNNP